MSKPVLETFKQYVMCGGYTDSTIDSKMRAAGLFCKFLGDIDIADITYGHVEDYQNMLRQGGRAAKTVNLYLTHIRHFMGWAVKRQYIDRNPLIGLKALPAEIRKQPVFKPDELVRLINIAPLRWKVLTCLGIVGLREGEALNLHRKDLDFETGYITISAKRGTADTWPWGIKNHTEAYAPLPDVIEMPDIVIPFRSLIQRLLESVPAPQPYVCVVPGYYQKLLRLYRAGRLHYRKKMTPYGNFDRDFKVLQKKACVTPLKSFQDLRRTFAERLRTEGYDLKDIQLLMRHSAISTTANYYLSVDEKELVARANDTFEGYRTNVS